MSSRVYKLVPYNSDNSYDNYFLCCVPADISIWDVMSNIFNNINIKNINVCNENLMGELLNYKNRLHCLMQPSNMSLKDFDANRVVFTI